MADERGVLTERIKAKARQLGFELVGVAPVRESDHAEFYRRWLAEGRHGEMAYLARGDAVARRLDPHAAWPELRSAVVVGLFYDGGGEGASPRAGARAGPRDPTRPDTGVIARYARGRDYHKVMKKKLLALLEWIEGEVGRELPTARAYVDTGPVLERELARRAGLGWFGRNTMLIHPRRGSYFFIGSLLLELELEPDAPFEADRCGRCSACVTACPTGALLGRDATGAPVIDATRCISYLTIENRGPIPRELRPAIANRIFGCDICQEVCPFNRRFARRTAEPAFAARGPGEPPHGVEALPGDGSHPGTDAPRLVDLLAMDEAGWEAFSRGSAIRRAGYAGFRRNVVVAIGNWLAGASERAGSGALGGGAVDGAVMDGAAPKGGVAEGGASEVAAAVAALLAALDDAEPLVRGHAAWGLGRVGTAEARRALESRLEVEEDPFVREELVAARWDTSAPSA